MAEQTLSSAAGRRQQVEDEAGKAHDGPISQGEQRPLTAGEEADAAATQAAGQASKEAEADVQYRRDRAAAYVPGLADPKENNPDLPKDDNNSRMIRTVGDTCDRIIKAVVKLQAAVLAIDPGADVQQADFDAMIPIIDSIKLDNPKPAEGPPAK